MAKRGTTPFAAMVVALVLGLSLCPTGSRAQQAPLPREKPTVAAQAAPAAKPTPAPVAEPAPSEPAAPTKVKVGMFVTQLYDLDMAKRSFNITFWTWYLTPDDKYKPLENVEIVNAKAFSVKFPSTMPKDDAPWDGKKGKIIWTQGKYAATIAQDWDVSKFPFDRQTLDIEMEDAQNDASQTEFIADEENSRLDSAIKIPGWTIESFKVSGRDITYDTTYGDPTLTGSSAYSRVVASIVIKHDGVRLLCSMFVGFFVAFVLVLLTYFMDVSEMAGSRIGLSAGAIFAAVGNKYVIDNYLPPASTFTVADGIELSTFLAIIFGILVIVLIQWFKERHPVSVRRFNNWAAVFSVVAYVAFNGYLIRAAAG